MEDLVLKGYYNFKLLIIQQTLFKLMDTKPIHPTYEVVKPFDEYKDGKYAEFSVDVEMNNEFIGRVLQMGQDLRYVTS